MAIWRFWITLICVVFTATAFANRDAQSRFNQGTSAFRAGDYSQALQHFVKAQQQGLIDSRLHYNLGMTFYKLGHYQKAMQALQLAAKDPTLASMAHVNMGLAAYKLQQIRLAADHFQFAYHKADNDKQKKFARALLGKFNLPSKTRWQSSTRINVGFNDNVRLQEKDVEWSSKLDQKDNFASLFGNWQWQMHKARQLDFSVYHVQYQKLDDRHFSQLNVAFEQDIQLLKFRIETGRLLLGGEEFLNQAMIRIQLQQDFRPVALQPYVAIYEFFNVNDSYEHLQGQMQRIGINAKWKHRMFAWNLDAQYENNNRKDLVDGGTLQQNYSPQRMNMAMRLTWQLRQFSMDFTAAYRQSKYNKADLLLAGLRQDRRTFFQYQIYYPMGRRWWLFAQLHALNNKSKIVEQRYQSNQTSLGFIWR